MGECGIEEIDFMLTGDFKNSDWGKDDGERFRSIIKGLGKEQGIRDNLNHLVIDLCSISKEDAKKILVENGLENVEVTNC